MKHGTIREVFARVLYDPNIDPSDIEVIFQDSDEFRCVPFTFIRAAEDGFYYRGNFYPFHKIIAIRDSRSGKYFLKRRPIRFRVLGDVGIEFPDFPIFLRAVYDDFVLQRYASYVLLTLLARMRESRDDVLNWFRILGEFNKVAFDDFEIYIIVEPGPFRGTLLIMEDDHVHMVRSIPTPLKLGMIIKRTSFHRAVIQEFIGDLEHVFRLGMDVLCVENITRITECDPGLELLERSLSVENLSLFILNRSGSRRLFAVCNQSEYRFLKFDFEQRIAEKIGLPLAEVILPNVRVRDIGLVSESSIIKIHDDDVIFAIKD